MFLTIKLKIDLQNTQTVHLNYNGNYLKKVIKRSSKEAWVWKDSV
jgi:hypothetical protein